MFPDYLFLVTMVIKMSILNLSPIKIVPECLIKQEMCHKTVNRCFFVFDLIPNQYKTQGMRDRVILKILFQ